MRTRGSTLIEVTLTMVLTSLVIGAATALYSFIAIRSADSISRFSTLQACQTLSSAISQTASNAVSVTTKSVGGTTALICVIPDAGVDRDGDGVFDYFVPSTTTKINREKFGSGKRVWFYPANAVGTLGSSGNYWFMAVRSDTSNPTVTDINRQWSFWRAGQPRVQILGTVTFTPVAASKLVRLRIVTTPSSTQTEDGGLANSRRGPNMDLNQRYFWRGSR